MSHLEINIVPDTLVFLPRETICGKASWRLDDSPENVELRLFWYTSGMGTQDVGIVEQISFDHPGLNDSRDFKFALPDAPYSFSGKLISLVWALELIRDKSKDVVRKEIIVSPIKQEILLTSKQL